jgi:hypothetical protein
MKFGPPTMSTTNATPPPNRKIPAFLRNFATRSAFQRESSVLVGTYDATGSAEVVV